MIDRATLAALVERAGERVDALLTESNGSASGAELARAALAAVASDIGAKQLRTTADYLAIVGVADDRRVATLLRTLAEAVDA